MLPAIQIQSKIVPKRAIFVRAIQACLDLFMLTGAFVLAYLLRFDFSLPADQEQLAILQIFFLIPFQFCILRSWRIHRFVWRYVSILEMNRIIWALAVSAVPLLVLRLVFSENPNFAVVPLSIIILDFLLAIAGVLGIRLMRRAIHEGARITKDAAGAAGEKTSVLLIGAGRAGVTTLSGIRARKDLKYDVKGFIDDDPFKSGSVINGVKVIGKTKDIPRKIRELNIEQVIITIAQASRRDIRRILNICEAASVKVKTIPGLSELLEENVMVSRIRDVEVEDLLGRSPVELDKQSIDSFLSGKTVLITGAGGSIGSELVRQLLHCGTERLILVERCEFALFNIENEIRSLYPQSEIVPIIGDICDKNRMRGVFRRYSPQVVFHAAAHKHVPMMEHNAVEALKNNVLGTNTVGELAGQMGVEAFVLVSTDKAINPTSIMGASKRVAELAVQNLNSRYATRFVAVRFGNVIGSNGSVIPIFQEQIKKGGPVTVTHPEMKRFFMTIPEASQLVLQAGAIGKGGEIFILDMGELVRILDLAHAAIRLSGLKPDEDIQVVFTGMRPGEKLIEEIETSCEQLTKTIHSKIFIGKIAPYPHHKVEQALERIEDLCVSEDDTQIREFLSELLPEATVTRKTVSPAPKTIPRKKVRAAQLTPAPSQMAT